MARLKVESLKVLWVLGAMLMLPALFLFGGHAVGGIVGVAHASSNADASVGHGTAPPSEFVFNGKTLKRNGSAIRKRLFFDVYIVSLYVSETSQDPARLMNDVGPKVLELRFLRDVGVDTIRGAWTHGFSKNCVALCAESSAKIAVLNGLMKDIKKGDVLVFSVEKDSILLELNGKVLGKVEGSKIDQNILAIFLGKEPPTEEVKKGLLGLLP